MTTCRNYLQPDRGDFGYTTYTGNGSTTQYAIGWDYPRKITVLAGASTPYVRVYVNGSETAYTLANNNTVSFGTAPANGAKIEIIRDSRLHDTLVDWSNNSAMTAENMQLENDQHQWLLQELWMHLKALGCLLNTILLEGGSSAEYLANGNGLTTTFSLNPETGLTDPQVLVFINGVRQATNTYSVTTGGGFSQVVFDEAPPSGSKLSFVVFQGVLVNYTIGDGTITTAKLADCSVTMPKLCLDNAGDTKQVAGWLSDGTNNVFDPQSLDHSWITDFDTGVRQNRLNELTAPNASVSMGNQKITNLATPAAGAEAVNKTYCDANKAGLCTMVRGVAALDGGNPSRATVTIGWQPSAVLITWDQITRTSNGEEYDICTQAFHGTGTEQRRTAAMLIVNGNDETIVHSLLFQATGFVYTLDSWIATGNIRYIAYK